MYSGQKSGRTGHRREDPAGRTATSQVLSTRADRAVGYVDPVRELGRITAELGELEAAAMVDAELASNLLRLRRYMDRLESVFTRWAKASEGRGIGLEDGARSTAAWIGWKTGRHPGAVNHTLRVAEVCELLPTTEAAWRAGEITTPAVEMIAAARVRGADDDLIACEALLLEPARRRDHRSLRLATQYFRKCAEANGRRPDDVDGFTLATFGDRCAVRGEMYGDAAETLAHTLSVFSLPAVAGDGTTAAQRRAAALVRACEVALGRGPAAEGARPAVTYITHAPTGDTEPLTLGHFTGVIGPADRDRLLCDATVTEVVVDADGVPISVGRATGRWLTAARQAVITRDGHCRFPGCEVPAPWCDVHHHRHRRHGGPSTSDNGVLLCRRHHTFVHRRSGWRTTFERQRFRVFRPDGSELHPDPWHDERLAAPCRS